MEETKIGPAITAEQWAKWEQFAEQRRGADRVQDGRNVAPVAQLARQIFTWRDVEEMDQMLTNYHGSRWLSEDGEDMPDPALQSIRDRIAALSLPPREQEDA